MRNQLATFVDLGILYMRLVANTNNELFIIDIQIDTILKS